MVDREGAFLDARSLRNLRLRNAAASTVVARGIGVASSVLLTPAVIRGMGTSRYGIYAAITALAGAAVVSDLGIGAGLVARLSTALGSGDLVLARRLVASSLAALAALGAVLAAAVVAATALFPVEALVGAEGDAAAAARLGVVVFGVAFGIGLPAGIGERVMSARQEGAKAAAWSLASGSLTLLVTATAAYVSGSIVIVVAAASLAPRLVGAAQTVVALRGTTLAPLRGDVTRDALRRLRSAGALFAVQAAAVAVAFESDVLVVSSMLGPAAAATYAVNARLIALIVSLPVLALGQLFPAFGEARARGDAAWVRATFRRITAGLAAYAVVVGMLMWAFEPRVVAHWATPEVRPSRTLLLGLVLWSCYTTLLVPANMLMNAAVVVGPQIFFAVAMAVVNLPLSIFLTRRLGVAGPAWGSLLSHVVVSLVPTILIVRRLLARGDPQVEP